jgi:hypothetical protein
LSTLQNETSALNRTSFVRLRNLELV